MKLDITKQPQQASATMVVGIKYVEGDPVDADLSKIKIKDEFKIESDELVIAANGERDGK